MAGPAADALRDALAGLARRLEALIAPLPHGDALRLRLEEAQSDLRDAASDVDAASVEAILTKDVDIAKLRSLTTEINARAAALAASTANARRLSDIASAAVSLGGALSGGSVLAVLGAASTLQTALG